MLKTVVPTRQFSNLLLPDATVRPLKVKLGFICSSTIFVYINPAGTADRSKEAVVVHRDPSTASRQHTTSELYVSIVDRCMKTLADEKSHL